MNKKRLVVGCSSSISLARSIAKKRRWKFSRLDVKKFPDGETNLRFLDNVKGKEVYLVQTLNNPDEKLIEIIFAAKNAVELGAKKVSLIAPYLCYMRQDKRFKPNEAVGSRIMADMLGRYFDEIITIDPHLHRYKSLREIFTIRTKTLTADGLIAEYVGKNIKTPVIIGPDMESYQWARGVAKMIGCEATVLKKKRYTSEHVAITIHSNMQIKGKSVVIIDDIISTGHTMEEVVRDVKKIGAARVCCIGVHALFVGDAYERLKKRGAIVLSCNTIPHKTNKIDVSGLISNNL